VSSITTSIGWFRSARRGVACGYVTFEDAIPADNYGGVESALGVLGYSSLYHCYGVQLTLRRSSAAPTAARRSELPPARERSFSAAGSTQAVDTNRSHDPLWRHSRTLARPGGLSPM